MRNLRDVNFPGDIEPMYFSQEIFVVRVRLDSNPV
nr:MAG TPA: hypothetical protein [Caudoviricetes sp.]